MMADHRNRGQQLVMKSSIGTINDMLERENNRVTVGFHDQQQQQQQNELQKPARDDCNTDPLRIYPNKVQVESSVVAECAESSNTSGINNDNMEVDGSLEETDHCDDDDDDVDGDVSQSFEDLVQGSDDTLDMDSSHTWKRHNLFNGKQRAGRDRSCSNDSDSSIPDLMSFCHGSFSTSNNASTAMVASLSSSSSSSSSFVWNNDGLSLLDSVPTTGHKSVPNDDGRYNYLHDHRHHSPTSTLMMAMSETPKPNTPTPKTPTKSILRSPYARQISSISSSSSNSSTSSCSRSNSRWEGGCTNDTIPSYHPRR